MTRNGPVFGVGPEVLDRSTGGPRAARRDGTERGQGRPARRPAALKTDDRAALEAFYLRGRSLKQMAREFDAPVGTIKRRLHVARQRLKDVLAGPELVGAGGDGGATSPPPGPEEAESADRDARRVTAEGRRYPPAVRCHTYGKRMVGRRAGVAGPVPRRTNVATARASGRAASARERLLGCSAANDGKVRCPLGDGRDREAWPSGGIVPQNNSSIGSPSGRIGCGRRVWSVSMAVVSMPRWR